jgi:hypothetical protein
LGAQEVLLEFCVKGVYAARCSGPGRFDNYKSRRRMPRDEPPSSGRMEAALLLRGASNPSLTSFFHDLS